jgi:RNA polymerase sigma-70 factor, ECF subfamily
VTEETESLHQSGVLGVASVEEAGGHAGIAASPDVPSFESLYDTYFPYVWRSVQRLGIPPAQVDDVVQEIFIVVHRKLPEFAGRSTLKTWMYGITLRVARLHRVRARKQQSRLGSIEPEDLRAPDGARPDERASSAEAARLVQTILDGMDDDQRDVFVLAELEQLSVPQIAEALETKLNTVYSRLRLARAAFAEASARLRARDGWRSR